MFSLFLENQKRMKSWNSRTDVDLEKDGRILDKNRENIGPSGKCDNGMFIPQGPENILNSSLLLSWATIYYSIHSNSKSS